MNKNLLKYIFILFTVCNIDARAQSSEYKFSKSLGVANARIVRNKIDIDSSKQLTFEIPIQNSKNTNGTQERYDSNSLFRTENNIVYKIRSESNSVLNIAVGTKDQFINIKEEESVTIDLKNEEGDVIKAKISVKDTKIIFDKKGQAKLQIKIDIPKESARLRGSYKATYFVVIQY